MKLDAITIGLFAAELNAKLRGSRLQKIFQPEEAQFIYKMRMPGENFFLFVCMEADHQRIHPLPGKITKNLVPSPFCMMQRKHIEGGIITAVDGVQGDRIIKITLDVKRGESIAPKTVVIELTGKHANIILLDHQNRYIGAFCKRDNNRPVITGQPYEPPQTPPGLDLLRTDREAFEKAFLETAGKNSDNIKDCLSQLFKNANPDYLKEIIVKSGLDPKKNPGENAGESLDTLWNSIDAFAGRISEGNISPVLYFAPEDPSMEEKPRFFAPWPFETLKQFPSKPAEDICLMLEEFFVPRITSGRFEDQAAQLLTVLGKKLKKVLRRIEKQEQDLKMAHQGEKYKKFGELILANLHRIEEKASSCTVDDYYQEPPVSIDIPLNPALSPSDNAQDYFRKYKKARRGQEMIAKRLEISRNEASELRGRMLQVSRAENLDQLNSLIESFEVDSFYSDSPIGGMPDGGHATKPRAFELAKGYVALVGRNSRQNDEITLKIGKKDDLWFHARQIPGSHVVLKLQKPSQTVPSEILYKAAQLAAYYSKAADAPKVPVDYTRVKNVRKVKGQKTGKVFYTDEKTIVAKPEIDDVKPSE